MRNLTGTGKTKNTVVNSKLFVQRCTSAQADPFRISMVICNTIRTLIEVTRHAASFDYDIFGILVDTSPTITGMAPPPRTISSCARVIEGCRLFPPFIPTGMLDVIRKREEENTGNSQGTLIDMTEQRDSLLATYTSDLFLSIGASLSWNSEELADHILPSLRRHLTQGQVPEGQLGEIVACNILLMCLDCAEKQPNAWLAHARGFPGSHDWIQN